MKKIILLNALILLGFPLFAQLSLDDCYAKARANYPLIKQADLIEKSKVYNVSNVNSAYLPQITFSAKATYQSEVTELPSGLLQSLGIQQDMAMSKDQYGATININQVIWDGGATKSRKERIHASSDMEKQSLEVDLYALSERVNQLFFSVLLLDAQVQQNQLFQDELQRNFDKISAYVENGIANQADLDAVKIEQLKAMQTKSQLAHAKSAYLNMLSAMIGEPLNESSELLKPAPIAEFKTSIQRPELNLFDAKIKKLESQNQEISSNFMPKFSVFLTGGYGRPGLNMLSNDFSGYYVIGANLSWNLSSFYTTKSTKNLVQTSIYSVENQRETFLFNVNLDISKKQSDIENCREQLRYDDEIIALRTSVKEASAVKVSNGALSVTDLMRDVNAEELAKQAKIVHEIELLMAMYNLKLRIEN